MWNNFTEEDNSGYPERLATCEWVSITVQASETQKCIIIFYSLAKLAKRKKNVRAHAASFTRAARLRTPQREQTTVFLES